MNDVNVGGRPTKYKPEYAEQARKLCDLGATDRKLCDFFDVSESTLNLWKLNHPEFSESLKLGKGIPDENVKRSLYDRAMGYTCLESKLNVVNGELIETIVEKHYPPDPTSAIFWLKNRLPNEFRDKVEHEQTNDKPLSIEIVRAKKPDADSTD